jgi:hypothetical protein
VCLDEIVVVSEGEVAAAIASLALHERVVAEGAGAVAVAALARVARRHHLGREHRREPAQPGRRAKLRRCDRKFRSGHLSASPFARVSKPLQR